MTIRLLSSNYAFICAAFLFAATSSAQAAEWNKTQTSVWQVVSDSWIDDVAGNGKWPSQYAHKEAVSWNESWPQPRGKASIEKWSRFAEKNGRTLDYELFPEAIVVVGDTAVVHYSVVAVRENFEKKRKREQGGNIETLVRSGKSWKILSLTGFELGGGN